jgi:hypothetical protein
MTARDVLDSAHYLGARGARARFVFEISGCVMTFSGPSSRRLPSDWLELSRWCIVDGVGSQHWKAALSWLEAKSSTTTIVSYSDPSVGHTGALYRACNWHWAPTWHVLRPPPTGAGIRGGKRQAAKHRWVFLLRPDGRRAEALALRDKTLARRFPFAEYREPQWKNGRPLDTNRANAYKLWLQQSVSLTHEPLPYCYPDADTLGYDEGSEEAVQSDE